MSVSELKTQFESQFTGVYCQIFLVGLSSGGFGDRGSKITLSGGFEFYEHMPAGLIKHWGRKESGPPFHIARSTTFIIF